MVSDPFPLIPPALLNSRDIRVYAESAIKMIDPFDPERLKPASYWIGLGKTYAVAKEQSDGLGPGWKWEIDEISPTELLTLKPNSLTYVAIDTQLNLPEFIAARFNLSIKHVYRGLLAGTGPLVDPGFSGELYIPLHNLSSNTYTMGPGEKLIWMEFTKLSPHPNWKGAIPSRLPVYEPAQFRSGERTFSQYLLEASDTPIRSSIQHALRKTDEKVAEAEQVATGAKELVDRLKTRGTLAAIAAAVTLSVALVAVFMQLVSTLNDVNARIDNLQSNVPAVTTPHETQPEQKPPTTRPQGEDESGG